jgi:hypothetical protein
MAQAGIRLDHALIFPYDTGGCFCDRCRPWIQTFLNLTEDLAAVIHQYHPASRVYITDWHCKDDEAARITDFYNRQRPAWLAGIWKDDRHPANRFASVNPSYQTLCFTDITEIGAWGTAGANPFARRFQTLFEDWRKNQLGGYMAYSEGIYDDFNKTATAQLAWNPARPAGEIAREYANYFFDTSIRADFESIARSMEDSWTGWLKAWGEVKFVQSEADALRLEREVAVAGEKLTPRVRDSWRWQALARRARIGRLAAQLHAPAEFRADSHVAIRRIEEKQTQLDDYRAAVKALREQVYREPATRFPPMVPDGSFMTSLLQVPTKTWDATLKALRVEAGSTTGR